MPASPASKVSDQARRDALATVEAARTHLIMDDRHPFYGPPSLMLTAEVSTTKTQTAGTDGTKLYVHPTWVAARTDAELQWTIAHETYHNELGHPWRIGNRDYKLANIAADLVINNQLADEKVGTAPPGILFDESYRGLSFEVAYARLEAQRRQQEQQEEETDNPDETDDDDEDEEELEGDPNGPPRFLKAPELTEVDDGDGGGQLTEVDWQIAAAQATMIARKAGLMAGDVERAVKESRQSGTDWRALLHRFVEQVIPSDTSWTHPNRRYIAQGLYLPGVVKENTPAIGVAVDTSGSINPEALNAFAAELTAIFQEVHPAAITVVYCDASVNHVETFTPDDEAITLHPSGGGGTRFQPAFDYFNAMDEPPAAVIYLTDLCSGDVPTEPDYPVLWATDQSVREEGPFGETVRLSPWS